MKLNLRDLSNHHYGYWKTGVPAKRWEIMRLGKLHSLSSSHTQTYRLSKHRANLTLKAINDYNLEVRDGRCDLRSPDLAVPVCSLPTTKS
jgi:hypothetical protein